MVVSTQLIHERLLDERTAISAKSIDCQLEPVSVTTLTEMANQTITINLTDVVYDAFINALLDHNSPLIEQDARQHKRRVATTPSEFIEQMIIAVLKKAGKR